MGEANPGPCWLPSVLTRSASENPTGEGGVGIDATSGCPQAASVSTAMMRQARPALMIIDPPTKVRITLRSAAKLRRLRRLRQLHLIVSRPTANIDLPSDLLNPVANIHRNALDVAHLELSAVHDHVSRAFDGAKEFARPLHAGDQVLEHCMVVLDD
jgi:hypothetical protein